METKDALAILEALSEPTRLGVVEMLVAAGPDGISAGVIAERLGRQPGSLSFHVRWLASVGLIASRREGRRIIYVAETDGVADVIGYLRTRCCGQGLRRDDAAALTALFVDD